MIKKNMAKHDFIRFLLVMAMSFCFSAVSCDLTYAQESTETRQLRQIAVMPFFKGKKPEKIETIMMCPVGRLCTEDEAVLPGAEKTMTSVLQKAMAGRYGDRVVPQEKTATAFDQVTLEQMAGKGDGQTMLDLAMKLGREVKAGYVVTGNVWRFTQRSGTALGSEIPASVAFDVHLIDVDRGARVWKGSFDKTQQPLSDNLLKLGDFIKHDGQWLTAEELARLGIKEVLKAFPVGR